MTRFQRPISASTKARQLYPDAFCQPMRPCSAITCRCRSRGVGSVSAVGLGTAFDRGGTMTAARHGRIARLTAPCRAWLGPPRRDRFFAEPHRQAATLAQGSIIFRPVGHPILLLGDVMTAIGIGADSDDVAR